MPGVKRKLVRGKVAMGEKGSLSLFFIFSDVSHSSDILAEMLTLELSGLLEDSPLVLGTHIRRSFWTPELSEDVISPSSCSLSWASGSSVILAPRKTSGGCDRGSQWSRDWIPGVKFPKQINK